MRMDTNLLSKLLLSLILFSPLASASSYVCLVYFTGIGCPHCAKTDPLVLRKLPFERENLVIVEYEIYTDAENPKVLLAYAQKYNIPTGVPLLILNETHYILGDSPILNALDSILTNLSDNPCLTLNGSIPFEELDPYQLPGKPKIWANGRLLERLGTEGPLLRELLFGNLSEILRKSEYRVIAPAPAPLSGGYVEFDNAIELGGYLLKWRGEPSVSPAAEILGEGEVNREVTSILGELTLAKIASLAVVDAINPCALAVLTLILITILTHNPKQKRNVLLAGLAFTTSVFVIYFLYGLLIIRFFQLVQALAAIRLVLYKILALIAIVLGLLQLKDAFWHKLGRPLTGVPRSWQSKVKRMIAGITSPRGAFLVGTFVTIFLLPCTIGPYVIAGGILSVLELLKTVPWLLFYNAIFVLPMIAITLLVYLGIARVEDVASWKDRNMRKLRGIAGGIMLLLGIGMFLGLI